MFGIIRSTKFAFRNTWRNLWLSVITVFLLVLTTISITLVGGLNVVGSQVINAVQSKVDIDLYFYSSVSEQQILEVQTYFKDMDEVTEVLYVSKDDALETFVGNHADEPEVLSALEELGTNPLPASLIVRAKDIDDYPELVARLNASEFEPLVDTADYSDSQEIISKIDAITDRVYQIGIVVSIIFIIISIIVIFNTLRIAIYSHREEIAIMKLVGATNWFIRSPFFIEGILLGIAAALITVLLSAGAVWLSDPAFTTFFSGYDFSLLRYFQNHLLEFLALEVAGTVVLSTASSMVAISRYLKV